jgi:hypothetical protein
LRSLTPGPQPFSSMNSNWVRFAKIESFVLCLFRANFVLLWGLEPATPSLLGAFSPLQIDFPVHSASASHARHRLKANCVERSDGKLPA